jgi:hypothetical protein
METGNKLNDSSLVGLHFFTRHGRADERIYFIEPCLPGGAKKLLKKKGKNERLNGFE